MEMDRNKFHQEYEVDGDLILWRISGFLNDNHLKDAKEFMGKVLEEGKIHVIIDFSGLSAIDSRGLGFLVSVQKELRLREGRLALVHLSAQFASLMELTKLNRIFEIFLDLETAKRSFGGPHLGLPDGQSPA